jgi:hypothetical protein
VITIDTKLKDKVALFKQKIGLFTIIDYFTDIGVDTAKGKLLSVSQDGDIEVVHLTNPKVIWGLNINQIRNYKFNEIKAGGIQ